MSVLLYVFGIGFILMAIYLVALNWGCVIVSERNKRRGIDRHHSTVPLVSVIFAVFAFIAYPGTPKFWLFIIPLLDIGNWMLLLLPVVLIQYWREKKERDGE